MSRPVRAVTLLVEPAHRAERLDRYLARRLPSVSRTHLRRLIEQGRVTLDGAPAWRAAQKVNCETIELRIPAADEEPPLVLGPGRVLLRDEAVLAVDKPAGFPVVARLARAGEDVRRAVWRLLDPAWDPAGAAAPPWAAAAHRLDRETSGVLVFGLSSADARDLTAAFERRRARKCYVARVDRAPDPPRGVVDRAIATPGAGGPRLDPGGKEARTRYRTLGPVPGGVLVLLRPLTGRTHQLRLHLAALGCPIQGDRVHGGGPAPRLLLHARSLRLPHPRTGATLVLRAPLPVDFLRAELPGPPGGCEVRPPSGDSSVPPGSNPTDRSPPP